MNTNNKHTAIGIISTKPEYDHTVSSGKNIYTFILDVPRKSCAVDKISVLIPEAFLKKHNFRVGDCVKINGFLRSHNVDTHTQLHLFANNIDYADDSMIGDNNDVQLIGYICKKPIYRVTPFGKCITDVIIAVNRPNHKTDYIPCICWGKLAKYVAKLPVGTELKISGRFQSRIYTKKLDGKNIEKTAYELSIHKISKVE